jgi:tRNA pseudouridine55 synthase
MSRRKPKGRALDGIILLDKPLGISSNKVLQIVKRLFKAQKAGHTGSLDPLATGMLPICFGEATKVSSFLLESNKSYQTTATLGKVTTTGDAEGEILQERTIPALNKVEINNILATFKGSISQIPPMYSALKHQGQPLYKLARKGIEIERKRRQITIFDLTLSSHTSLILSLHVSCSKGTYIRTLVEDIGEALGCGAYVSMLRRISLDPFYDHKMVSLDMLEEYITEGKNIDQFLLPTDAGLSHFQAITLTEKATTAYLYGQSVAVEPPFSYPKEDITDPNATTYLRTYDYRERFLGVSTLSDHNNIVPKRLMVKQDTQ